MIKNYLKIAIRNFKKKKLYSFVNLFGLTIGLITCMLISIYIRNEVTYDNFHAHAERIVRVTSDLNRSGTAQQYAQTGTKVGPTFKRSFPQVQQYVRTMKSDAAVRVNQQGFEEKNILYADADFFTVFSFPLIQGRAASVLDAPQKVVLSRATAKKYFGKENPVGKTIQLNGGETQYEITGISENAPTNSQIQYDLVISFSSLQASKTEVWRNANYITYLLLQNPDQIPSLTSAVTNYMQKVNEEEMGFSKPDYYTVHLEPLRSVHLHSELPGLEVNGNLTYIYVLAIVAFLILLIACVNYTNLSIAQSASRGIEIGIRQVMGAGKNQLLKQFLGESSLLTGIALCLALLSSMALLPLFNHVTGKSFSVSLFISPVFLIAAICLSAVISLLAGFYPALVLSNKKLTKTLKSGVQISNSGGMMRKGLIVFQFTIAIFLLAATIIVLQQMRYIQSKELGYDRSQVLVLPVDGKTRTVYEQLKNAFQANPNVLSVTGAYEDPTAIAWGDGIQASDASGPKELSLNATPVDLAYLKTMGMNLLAGRDFTPADYSPAASLPSFATEQTAYILNEKAVRDLGWTPENAIGQIISRGVPGPVVGVVKDFHFASLHAPIGPLLIFPDTSLVRQLFVKIKQENMASTLASLETAWKARVGHRPFDYHFLDDDFQSLYQKEGRIAKLFSIFSSIAIALACMGLFALAAFTTTQRIKEIGIRKVLGADVTAIVALICKQFLVLVGIAFIIACPFAWWLGSDWLNDFAYRTELSSWIFAFAGITALAIAGITISFHAIRAALANPVKSLRNE